jgi:hypothetical protein
LDGPSKHFMGKNMGKSSHPKTHKPSYLMNNKEEVRVCSSTINIMINL